MRFRTAIGVGLILSSFAMFGGGTYLLQSASDAKVRSDLQLAATEQQCIRLLNTIAGAKVTPNEEEITVLMPTVTDPRQALTDTTVATLMCPNKVLSEACLGDECDGALKGAIGLRLKFVRRG